MGTLDFLFSPEAKYFFMEQTGSVICGQLPVLHKSSTSTKMQHFNP